ncbi:peritrophin-55 [Drosophila ficusphila]|uniref:peritrophin-55 n=1 Tax=Drosophila ficusphila TaxID=30025 RepID=UPI0007E80575|nr:peritrophin-55 [Drosophila ficusphila]
MKAFALTLLSLLALSQARMDYKLQCARSEISIRWPSYHSNSEYYVCPSVNGTQLTVHCPAGEVFTFVLQQCVPPRHYIPAPPMNVLPTAAPVTQLLIDDAPPVISGLSQLENETPEHHEHHEHHEHKEHSEHSEHHHEHHEEEAEIHPIPPTPAPEPPTPPTVQVSKNVAPVPKKPTKIPVPTKSAAAKKTVAAKKPAPPTPAKAAKKPTPPSKVQKKPATA